MSSLEDVPGVGIKLEKGQGGRARWNYRTSRALDGGKQRYLYADSAHEAAGRGNEFLVSVGR